MTETAIRTRNLVRQFGAIRAVDGLWLEVPAGVIFGFLGPNGAGKTTTIRLLLGLLEPTAGYAKVLGYCTQSQGDKIRARTGALLEHTGLYDLMSAEDNLDFYGRANRLSPSERRTRIKTLLKGMGLWERRQEMVGKLSRGMKQKLALARVLLHRPRLVLLDEPTAGLDVPSAAAVREYLGALVARENTTVFLTTHNMGEAETLCDQVAVICQGTLVALGSPDQLRARSTGSRIEIFGRGFSEKTLDLLRARPEVRRAEFRNRHLILNLRQADDTAPLISTLVDVGVQVEEVRRGEASLEEVFMTLMSGGTTNQEE
jgi:ABC-2 type transport system ATP-binding protein